MLTREGYDRIKKFIHWEDKPDGAIDALVDICAEACAEALPAAETHEQRIERGNRELGVF